MTDVSTWSPLAGGNTIVSPDGFPEGMLPSGVNDSSREVMAAVRRFYDDLLDGTTVVQNSNNLGGSSLASVVARVNHTGTQLMSTISNAGALALENQVQIGQVANNVVGNPQLANMVAETVKANLTGAPADPADVTLAALATALNAFIGVTGTVSAEFVNVVIPVDGGADLRLIVEERNWPFIGGGTWVFPTAFSDVPAVFIDNSPFITKTSVTATQFTATYGFPLSLPIDFFYMALGPA